MQAGLVRWVQAHRLSGTKPAGLHWRPPKPACTGAPCDLLAAGGVSVSVLYGVAVYSDCPNRRSCACSVRGMVMGAFGVGAPALWPGVNVHRAMYRRAHAST